MVRFGDRHPGLDLNQRIDQLFILYVLDVLITAKG
jgi:hypothetical protein